MSLKLSAGCQCCEGCPSCSGTTPDEFDATITGFVDGAMCTDCSDLDGVYSLLSVPTTVGCLWKYSATSPPTGKVATCDGYYEWITDIYLQLVGTGALGAMQWHLRIHLNAASNSIDCEEDAGGLHTVDCDLDAFDFTGCFWWDPEFHCGLSSFGVSVSAG
jgi:hypothetical protein